MFSDPTNDFGPVGNDTGADILAAYDEWNGRGRANEARALRFVEDILSEWEMSADGDDLAQRIRDEAFIALAFSQIILEGRVMKAVAERAREALGRQATRDQSETAATTVRTVVDALDAASRG